MGAAPVAVVVSVRLRLQHVSNLQSRVSIGTGASTINAYSIICIASFSSRSQHVRQQRRRHHDDGRHGDERRFPPPWWR
jgi:hypothetical protein